MSKAPEAQSFETYLAQIAHELRDLPSQARAEELREIEAHLGAMIEARDDDSIAEALKQFGKPKRVGRDLRRAWERRQPEAWSKMGVALLSGLLILTTSKIVKASLGLPSAIETDAESDEALAAFMRGLLYTSGINFFMFMALGYVTKVVSPKRGMLALLLMFSLAPALRLTANPFDPIAELFAGESFISAMAILLLIYVSFLVPISIGAHLGARHGRKLLSHSAKAN